MKAALAGLLIGLAAMAPIVARAFVPTLTIAGVANGATVSGVVPLTARASEAGVTSLQFRYAGTNSGSIGAEITAGACATTWDTRLVSNGAYTLTAVGVVAGANVPSAPVSVTVNNAPPAPVPTDATVSAWALASAGDWSACVNGTQTRAEVWTRTVITPATNGGSTPPLSETRTGTQACVVTPPAVRFAIGQAIQTTTTVNVRAVGGGTLLGTQAPGAVGAIIAGPTFSNATTWWQIDYATGVDGWSGEDLLTPYAAPVPVDATVSAWSAWTVGAWSTCVSGSQTRTETRTRTVITPASNGGITPVLSETRTATQACTMPVVPAAPTATAAAASCSVKDIAAVPPAGTGWAAEFFLDGQSLGTDTRSPYTRPALTVAVGAHALTVRWSKSGEPTRTSAERTVNCQ